MDNPQDHFSTIQALACLSLQDRKLTLANLQKIEGNIRDQSSKAQTLICNGGDEHTTVFLKLETHLSKIKKITGDTMFLKLCDMTAPAPPQPSEQESPKNNQLPLESLIKQIENSLKNKLEQIKPLVQQTVPDAYRLIHQIELHVNEIVHKKAAFLLSNHADKEQEVAKNKKKKKNKHKKQQQQDEQIDNQEQQVVKEEEEQKERSHVEAAKIKNDDNGQIMFDQSVDYQIIKSKIRIEHPWKEIDFIVQCEYEGEYKNGKPHGLGRISLVNSQGLNQGLSFSGFGQFEDGKLHGLACIQLGGGFVFSGHYKQGKWDGIGRSYAPNGACYFHGNFRKWQWHGQGVVRDRKTGNLWSGEWFENLMKEGVLTKANTGDRFLQIFNPTADLDNGVFWSSLQQVVKEEKL